MKLDRKRAVFGAVLVLLVVLGLEGGLALLARVSPRVHRLLASPWASYTVPDLRLGHRPNPDYPGHDAKGFRNARVPDAADIVALGDSQTYGTGVEPEQAWPSQLESLTGKTVYSMAFGGYGPAHGLLFWDEAAALRPAILLDAVYAGNDYFDSFDLVYNRGQLPELLSPDPDVQQRVRAAERASPLAEQVASLFTMDAEGAPAEQGWTREAPARTTLQGWIATRSSLYGLLRRARFEWDLRSRERSLLASDDWQKAQAFARAHPEYCQAFDGSGARTVFTSAYRLAALDQDDPRIREGLQVALRALRRTHDLAQAKAVRFIVVLIPTKEAVFEDLAPNPPESYRRLMENETLARRTLVSFLEENRIEYVDALPALRLQLAKGSQPYHVTHDGHPNEHGHRAIARLVAAHLMSPQPR